MPACGEMEQIRLNETNINIAMSKIGGNATNFNSKYYWSSTHRSDDGKAWRWGDGWHASNMGTTNSLCRVVCAFQLSI